MSGNWNRTPRKGEKSINAIRSDHEHAVRVEYRNAGIVEGLVSAWRTVETEAGSRARYSDGGPWETVEALRAVSLDIAVDIVARFPKQGRMALSDAGATTEYLDHVEERVQNRRRLVAAAIKAAKAIGGDIDGT